MSVFGPSVNRKRTVVSAGVVEERNGSRPVVFRVNSPFVKGTFSTLEDALAARAAASGRGSERLRPGPSVRAEGNLPYVSRLHPRRERSRWVAHTQGMHQVFESRADAARAVIIHLRAVGRPVPVELEQAAQQALEEEALVHGEVPGGEAVQLFTLDGE